MATSLKASKRVTDRENSRKYLSFGEKIVKVGPVDPEIIWFKLKKKKYIYSPSGNFAERAKLRKIKYIAQSASLPSGLKNSPQTIRGYTDIFTV